MRQRRRPVLRHRGSPDDVPRTRHGDLLARGAAPRGNATPHPSRCLPPRPCPPAVPPLPSGEILRRRRDDDPRRKARHDADPNRRWRRGRVGDGACAPARRARERDRRTRRRMAHRVGRVYVPGNGMRALQRLGLADQVAAAGAVVERRCLRDDRGRPARSTSTKPISGVRWRCPIALPRRELHRILADGAADTPIRIRRHRRVRRRPRRRGRCRLHRRRERSVRSRHRRGRGPLGGPAARVRRPASTTPGPGELALPGRGPQRHRGLEWLAGW